MSKNIDRTRTERILKSFHIFYHSKEVEVRVLTHAYAVSRKTALRDVQLLKRAGLIQVKYSRKYKAFIPAGECFVPEYANREHPDWPENHAQKLYMEKIIRLCTLMTEVVMSEVKNPIEWYRKQYPKLSERTRQRDFLELKKIDYIISYEPEDWTGPAGYFYAYPQSAFERL